MSQFVISLDFELFWGVAHSQTVATYGRNVQGEWEVVPSMLALFRRYGVRVSWATVGMAMCRNYQEWRAIRPSVLPGYRRRDMSTYAIDHLAREYPRLFFARPLVEQILATPGQELATHTYSHFYCGEPGATPEQFAADLACSRMIAADFGVRYSSLVFPRNQIADEYLSVLPQADIQVYRGNPAHWLYRDGNAVAGGLAGRAIRFADTCLPISGSVTRRAQTGNALVNLPASLFLYPCSNRWRALTELRLCRIKQGMTEAARTNRLFHLWWHPHNFGLHAEENLMLLESLLQHYRRLSDRYGMQSRSMGDFAGLAKIADAEVAVFPRHRSATASQPWSRTTS
jgi:peptidoglycan/xylan/chitin deacetylase (PgdA/CDA1 family)